MVTAAELVGFGTVLESPTHGPELCLNGLMLSLPPQGGGPAVVNWDWSAVDGYESLNGTTWGDYTVVGTYDGSTFTMTRPPRPGQQADGDLSTDEEPDPFGTPCPEPSGGWRVLDPFRTTDESMERVFEEAQSLEGYAGSWVDQSINPADGSGDEDSDLLMNDPTRLIVNVAVTGDTASAEARLREFWGGALCVSRARHTKAELTVVLEELIRTPGLLGAGTGRDRVELEVIHDDGSLQRELDGRYGAGVVAVTSALRPYRG